MDIQSVVDVVFEANQGWIENVAAIIQDIIISMAHHQLMYIMLNHQILMLSLIVGKVDHVLCLEYHQLAPKQNLTDF